MRSKNREFAELLVKTRASIGFETAYKFYHRNGGRRHFHFTFAHYLRIERGNTIPSPEGLEAIFIAMRMMPTQKESRALMLAYVKATLGGGRLADWLLNPLLFPEQQTENSPGAFNWMRQHATEHYSLEQFRAIAATEASYWCSEALASDIGTWTPEKLASRLKLQLKDVRKALKSLAAVGVLAEKSGGYTIRQKEKFFMWPGTTDADPCWEKVYGYWKRSEERRTMLKLMVLRSTDSAIMNFRRAFGCAVDSCNAYATHNPQDKASFYLVRGEIEKLKDF